MKEKDLKAAIEAGTLEHVTLFGVDTGWELWAEPAPRGMSSRLQAVSGKPRAFKQIDSAVKLLRQNGWNKAITIDGMTAAA